MSYRVIVTTTNIGKTKSVISYKVV